MRVNDLVRVFNDPLEGEVNLPEGILGVLKEVNSSFSKVQFPNYPLLTYRTIDISAIDHAYQFRD